jgi:signal transduction histidine kinase
VQFFDHIPEILDMYERRLRMTTDAEVRAAEAENRRMAAQHGVVRWQQAYRLQEVMEDWGHLQLCVLQEIERYASDHAEVPLASMSAARLRLTAVCNEGVSQSALEYAQLQQAEASGRLTALEQALARLQDLEQQRAEAWREAAHDLRGKLGVVKNATAGLSRPELPEASRDAFHAILRRGVDSLHLLLNDLVDLARLEAGREQRNLAAIDAAQVMRELCEGFRPLAAERSLFLHIEGPDSLPVESDTAKLQRIAQNLILNALRYTEQGGVRVSWRSLETADASRWLLCVEDTGPGFDDGAMPAIADALKEGTDELNDIEQAGGQLGVRARQIDPAPTLPSASATRGQSAGEGIGLSIVKRVCELLEATLELETRKGHGTTFRVNFPRSYRSWAGGGSR